MAISSLFVLLFALGFWLYGGGRTLRETVGFDVLASLSGLFLGFFLPMIFALAILVWSRIWTSQMRRLPVLSSALAMTLILGSVVSEFWILRDEARFSNEASGREVIYSRERAWPNQDCSLVYVPGQGIHSTD